MSNVADDLRLGAKNAGSHRMLNVQAAHLLAGLEGRSGKAADQIRKAATDRMADFKKRLAESDLSPEEQQERLEESGGGYVEVKTDVLLAALSDAKLAAASDATAEQAHTRKGKHSADV